MTRQPQAIPRLSTSDDAPTACRFKQTVTDSGIRLPVAYQNGRLFPGAAVFISTEIKTSSKK